MDFTYCLGKINLICGSFWVSYSYLCGNEEPSERGISESFVSWSVQEMVMLLEGFTR